MSLAALAATSVPVLASEQSRFPHLPQVSVARRAAVEDPMTGADANACINRPEVFERGAIDNGTFMDGMRILSSIGRYYFERNVGPIEQQFARADRYEASLENCSLDDLRVAAYMLNTQFPEVRIDTGTIVPITITSRDFAIGELRRRLEVAARDERRSGV